MTYTNFNDSERLLDRFQNFISLEVKKLSAPLPKKWKKSFVIGFIIPTKMRFCIEGNDK